MSRALNLIGERFGRLLVTKRLRYDRKSSRVCWVCRCDCGQFKHTNTHQLRSGKTRSCGCLRRDVATRRRGTNHPSYRGGWITKNGYKKIRVNARTVLEHRHVMELVLQRPLRPEETVHHINGIRDDNRVANLELHSSKHAPGQKVSDKIAYAKDILRLYEPTALVS